VVAVTGATAGLRPWTEADDQILRAGYRRGNAANVAAALGRTVGAVRARAMAIGATVARHWTATEEALLWKLWGSLSLRQIANRVRHTTGATYVRARELKIIREERASTETVTQASARTGFSRTKLVEILKQHHAATEYVSRYTTKYKARPYYRLDPFEVDEAIAAHLSKEPMGAAARRRGLRKETLKRALARIGVTKPASIPKRGLWRLDDETIERALATRRPAVTRPDVTLVSAYREASRLNVRRGMERAT
jgi:hypothetical protein